MASSSIRPTDAWEALFRAQVSIMRDLRREFVDVGMSMNEYDVLFNIHREPGHRVRLRDLNASVLITQSSVSRLVDRLVARGFIAKSEDEFDARGTIVELTEEGQAAFRSAGRVQTRSIQSRVGSVLSKEELATLTDLCNRLRGDDCGGVREPLA